MDAHVVVKAKVLDEEGNEQWVMIGRLGSNVAAAGADYQFEVHEGGSEPRVASLGSG